MASASLRFECEKEGRRFHRLQADVWNVPAFAGPATRNWVHFRALGPGDAQYQWRSGADRAREAAAKFACGKLCLREACTGLEWYPDKLEEHIRDTEGIEEPGRAVARGLQLIAAGEGDPAEYDSPFSYYFFEDDRYLHDAVEALALPPWATHEQIDDGGPGSGYVAAFVALDAGYTIEDLERWLTQAAARLDSPPAPRRTNRRGRLHLVQ